MLQWLGHDYNSNIIYNDLENFSYVAKIANINTGIIKTVSDAVYAVDANAKFSITLNFERCFWTRAYSYAPISNSYWNQRIPPDDGIYRIDLETGIKKNILRMSDFLEYNGKDDGVSSHWFEHIQMNPSDSRFAFYHRYGSNERFVSNLYTADISGQELWPHPKGDNDRISHLGWKSQREYVVFVYKVKASKQSFAEKTNIAHRENATAKFITKMYRRLIKPAVVKSDAAIREKRQYYQLTSDQKGIQRKLVGGLLSRDGHPSFSNDGRYMLSDTYADVEGYRHLYVYDLEKQKVTLLSRVYSTYNSCGWRADLHPRFSPDNSKVIVDSTHSGYHQMVVFNIDWKLVSSDE
jgi:Tol biopolymer transport system component